MNRSQLDEIMDSVDKHLAASGFECIEAEWVIADSILRIYIDRPTGVDMGACVEATRLLEDWAGVDGKRDAGYTLEVSSPGIERPLRRRKHFEKFLNSDIYVRLSKNVNNRGRGQGCLNELSPEGLVKIKLTEGGEWEFPFELIRNAHLVHKWDS